MKHFLISVFTALLCISCNMVNRPCDNHINFIPCEQEDSDEIGYIDRHGNFTRMHNGYLSDLEPIINNYGLIDYNLYRFGREIGDSTLIMSDLLWCGIMNDDRIPVCGENERINVIDGAGNIIFELNRYNGKEVIECGSFSDKKLKVRLEDNSYIFVDLNGQQLFDDSYTYATDFHNGHAIVQTTNSRSSKYNLINDKGETQFSFLCDDSDDIIVSFEHKYLTTKSDDEVTIYNFKGEIILQCPGKVESIQRLCNDAFIYENDYEYGLMSYDGETLIRNRYEILVPNGKYFLALTDNEEIHLIDRNDNLIKTYDGDDIIDFRYEGYEFPCLIENPDGDFMAVNREGKIIAEGLDIDIDQYDISDFACVSSDFFPEEAILDRIGELCENGNGISDEYGAFFVKGNVHCTPKKIPFLQNAHISPNTKIAEHKIAKSINYEIDYRVLFDEYIIKSGEKQFNPTAWLDGVIIIIKTSHQYRSLALFNKCVELFNDFGCKELTHTATNYMFSSPNEKYLYMLMTTGYGSNAFGIIIRPNNDYFRTLYENLINNLPAN